MRHLKEQFPQNESHLLTLLSIQTNVTFFFHVCDTQIKYFEQK